MLPAAWLGPAACLGLSTLLLLVGLWAVRRLARDGSVHDPGWIVVDEGARMLLALSLVPPGAPWLWVVAAFVLFRAFDILKLGPVGWADRRVGFGWVMPDDLLAGAVAAVTLVLLLRALWPGVPPTLLGALWPSLPA